MTRSRALPFAVVLAILGVIFAGRSRSSLQGELGLPVGSPCVTSEDCAGGATCDPSSQLCTIEDAGSDAGNDASCVANLLTDPNNCGSCGNVCATGSSCFSGVCVGPNPSCASGGCPFSAPLCCASGCADTTSDDNNCGACGIVCNAEVDETCINGTCVGNLPPPPPACGPCASPEACCSGQCTDTSTDPNNCGGCGLGCPVGTFGCQNGECCTSQGCTTPPICSCIQGDSCCSSGCTDTSSDLQNCGGCGLACPAGLTQCLGGQCCSETSCGTPPECNCSVGQTCCLTGCATTSNDPNNCGGCAIVCPTGASCVGSVCTTPPPPNTCNGGPWCTGGESCCASGCSDVLTDSHDCGVCGNVCPTGESCVGGSCQSGCGDDGGAACTAGQECCPGGCANIKTDPDNCGGCNVQCGSTAACDDGQCVASEGAFDPIVNPTYLSPGVHSYTTITVPAGVTVYVGGAGALSGTLDLHATGAIEIDGTIDVSGGPGTQNTITSESTESGKAGGGGFTGEPYETAAALSAACSFVAGNPGSLGFAVSGSAGTCAVGSSTVCQSLSSPGSLIFAAGPGEYGGGAGIFTGFRAYGSGGGGAAGGAPGALGAPYAGEADCTGASGGGGAVNGGGGAGGGAPYDGTAGALGQTQCAGIAAGVPAAYVGGGGGGSIGETAASDLAVTATFQTGSAGGGGSADYLNRPVFGGTSGGGGGGGALKLETPATITITGQLLANGGIGGDSVIGTGSPNCNPQPGAAGGGGSGGVIYLSAPSITVSSSATITALGGTGGEQSEFATGGAGGAGGLGRIRLSVTPATCSLQGTFDPPLASGCSTTPGGTTGSAYVGTYPN